MLEITSTVLTTLFHTVNTFSIPHDKYNKLCIYQMHKRQKINDKKKGYTKITFTHDFISRKTFRQQIHYQTRMWANAQRDGRLAEYMWRPLFNATVWLTPTTRVLCSNAAKTRNPLKLPGVPQTNETISAASGPKFTIL